ncbi:hypothetical protein Q8A67_001551 [Cirrhinus molitorella]|uniref:Pyrin domain-containing protein n=1 Tax=Cirrhinus molitorella TaxID=172907 RepID=A0AA88QEJ1_9TELE|nr:hypothetical protein Q8A67_001551 [Cirrhinus molitorella]
MTVHELLLKTLEDLDNEKLNTFKWYLKHDELASVADVEKADAPTKIVDLIIARYQREGAVEITLDILKKMKENNIAKKLEDKHKDGHVLIEHAVMCAVVGQRWNCTSFKKEAMRSWGVGC